VSGKFLCKGCKYLGKESIGNENNNGLWICKNPQVLLFGGHSARDRGYAYAINARRHEFLCGENANKFEPKKTFLQRLKEWWG